LFEKKNVQNSLKEYSHVIGHSIVNLSHFW